MEYNNVIAPITVVVLLLFNYIFGYVSWKSAGILGLALANLTSFCVNLYVFYYIAKYVRVKNEEFDIIVKNITSEMLTVLISALTVSLISMIAVSVIAYTSAAKNMHHPSVFLIVPVGFATFLISAKIGTEWIKSIHPEKMEHVENVLNYKLQMLQSL